MRVRVFAAFVVGIAFGVTALGAWLWWSERSRSRLFMVPGVASQNQLPEPAAGDKFRARAEVPALTPGPQPVPQASSVPALLERSGSSADRIAPPDEPGELRDLEAKRLMLPVTGVSRQTLSDTYSDLRGGTRRHEALDIMAPRGTPVVAVEDGNVVKLFTSKQGGLTVYQFDNSRKWCYYYAHLDRYADGLREGMLLRKGDTLGYVGSTGDADPAAPHLHFSIFKLGPEQQWWRGTPVNPYALFAKQ